MLKSRLRLAKPPTSKPAGGGGPVQLGAAACSWEREQQTSASSLRETNERQAKEIESLKRKLRWALHLRAPERIYTPHLHPDHLTDSGPQAPLSYQAGGGDFLVEGHAEAYGAGSCAVEYQGKTKGPCRFGEDGKRIIECRGDDRWTCGGMRMIGAVCTHEVAVDVKKTKNSASKGAVEEILKSSRY